MLQIQNEYLKFAYEEFQVRLSETEAYIEFVIKISSMRHPYLTPNKTNQEETPDSIDEEMPYSIDRELTKTLRASSYLMLYNLLESTMSNTINAIHEIIKHEQRDIMDLSGNLHKIILTNLQKGLNGDKINELVNSHQDHREQLFDLGYNKKKLFSGNINCDIISKYCKKYGFQPRPVTQDGEKKLLWQTDLIGKIKEERNNLAHGSISFGTCGQNTPIDSLQDYLDSVKAVLLGVFNGTDKYVNEQRYLKQPASPNI